MSRGCPPRGRSSSTPTSTPPVVGEQTVFGPTGRMEEGQRLILLDQIQSWCGDSRTKVTIKPVIDLNADLSTTAYEIPDRIREQVVLRDRTCVFPWCTRPARGCDIDHVVEYDHDAEAEGRPQPGPTQTRTSRRCAATTTDSRPTPPGATDDRARRLRVDQPPRPPLPTRPVRHHAPRTNQRARATRPTMTPPHTPPNHQAGPQACPGAARPDHPDLPRRGRLTRVGYGGRAPSPR